MTLDPTLLVAAQHPSALQSLHIRTLGGQSAHVAIVRATFPNYEGTLRTGIGATTCLIPWNSVETVSSCLC